MLKERATEPELMDDLGYHESDLKTTLQELDFINRWLGGEWISFQAFDKLNNKATVETVVDLGCGSGSLLAKLKHKYPSLKCNGIDANPHIIEYARESHPDVYFTCQNIFDQGFASSNFDVIHCCLFLHHFTDEQLVNLLTTFKKQAKSGIIINDLQRHPLAYWSISILTALFSRSKLVRNDARLSVARGFKRREWQKILNQAGIKNYDLKWKWAFRWQLIIHMD